MENKFYPVKIVKKNGWHQTVDDREPTAHGVESIYLNIKTGETYNTKKYRVSARIREYNKELREYVDLDNPYFEFYDTSLPYDEREKVKIPLEHLLVAWDGKTFEKWKTLSDLIQPGDFVKCKNSRARDWRKVIEVKDKKNIYGQAYQHPKEGYERFTSSENGIMTITAVVRDGKLIYGRAKGY